MLRRTTCWTIFVRKSLGGWSPYSRSGHKTTLPRPPRLAWRRAFLFRVLAQSALGPKVTGRPGVVRTIDCLHRDSSQSGLRVLEREPCVTARRTGRPPKIERRGRLGDGAVAASGGGA